MENPRNNLETLNQLSYLALGKVAHIESITVLAIESAEVLLEELKIYYEENP